MEKAYLVGRSYIDMICGTEKPLLETDELLTAHYAAADYNYDLTKAGQPNAKKVSVYRHGKPK